MLKHNFSIQLAYLLFFRRALVLVIVYALFLSVLSCTTTAKTGVSQQPTSIFNPNATVIPVIISPAPPMKISVPGSSDRQMIVTPSPTPPRTITLNPPTDPVSVSNLALPFDPDEIAAILKANPSVHFRYKHRAFVFPNCSTMTHLGEIMELYSSFTEGNLTAPKPPSFKVYAPTDMRILKVWGTQRYRLIINSRMGVTQTNQPGYLSLLTLSRLEPTLAEKLARLAGVTPDQLKLNISDPFSVVGPYLFTPEYQMDVDDVRASNSNLVQADDSILIRKGEILGYKEGPWEWYPTCEGEHTLSLHVFPTTNNVNDQTQAVETFVPEITRHYLNLVVRELVIQRGLRIDVQYRSRNVGHDHAFLAEELFTPEVRSQVSLSPWLSDIHPQRFTVSPSSSPPVIIGEDE